MFGNALSNDYCFLLKSPVGQLKKGVDVISVLVENTTLRQQKETS